MFGYIASDDTVYCCAVGRSIVGSRKSDYSSFMFVDRRQQIWSNSDPGYANFPTDRQILSDKMYWPVYEERGTAESIFVGCFLLLFFEMQFFEQLRIIGRGLVFSVFDCARRTCLWLRWCPVYAHSCAVQHPACLAHVHSHERSLPCVYAMIYVDMAFCCCELSLFSPEANA